MPAAIEVRDGRASMFYAGEVPWHGLGTQVDEALTSEEAIVQAGLDWEVKVGPLYGGPTRRDITKFEGRYAIYRDDDKKLLGIASRDYQPWQNREAFAFVDSLVADGVMRFETAGALWGGRTVWMLARMEEGWRINDDEHTTYIALHTSHDAGGAIAATDTDVRVVCWNTLQMAFGWNDERARFRTTHRRGLEARLEEGRKLLEITTENQRRYQELLRVMARREIEADELSGITEVMFGPPDMWTKGQRKSAVDKFLAIYTAEMEINGATAYSLLNAVTGFNDHARGYRGDDDAKAQRRLQETQWGWWALQKNAAARAVQELVA